EVSYENLKGEKLLELRGTGGMTVVPPSLHKETGEQIMWYVCGEPAHVKLNDLRRAADRLAACALIAPHWPPAGRRDSATMALHGALARAGWSEEDAENFVEATAVAAGDEEATKRASKAARTKENLEQGKEVTGWPKLSELLGERGPAVVSRVKQ